jgi:predicted AAA+ superfamily ATPase
MRGQEIGILSSGTRGCGGFDAGWRRMVFPLRISRATGGYVPIQNSEIEVSDKSNKSTDSASQEILSAFAEKLDRLTLAVEAMAGRTVGYVKNIGEADTFVWHPENGTLKPVAKVNRIDLGLLKGIDQVRDILIENTERFASGKPSNNVLLWGARGMGKSSLVKAAQAHVNADDNPSARLKLIEIHREDIDSLPQLLNLLRERMERVILFCDDLSFDHDDSSYKSLKAALDGGVEGRPDNVIFYATSNRRHLLPRDMMENERSTAINPSEAVEEKVSLSDRFGLWLGFHKCSQDEYLDMIDSYANYFKLRCSKDALHRDALEWSTTRGARSGRVAWQFIQDLAGRLGDAR